MLNTTQKVILIAGLTLLCMGLLLVPWQNGYGGDAGYHFIFTPGGSRIDFPRMVLPLLALVVATAGGLVLARQRLGVVAAVVWARDRLKGTLLLVRRHYVISACCVVVLGIASGFLLLCRGIGPPDALKPEGRLGRPILPGLLYDGLDVTVIRKSDGSNYIRGKVRNKTGQTLHGLELRIKTATWERDCYVEVAVPINQTRDFSIYVEKPVDVKSFDLSSGI